MPRRRFAAFAAVATTALAAPGLAQPGDAPTRPTEATDPIDSIRVELASIPTSELTIRLAPLTLDELKQLDEAVLADVRQTAAELAEAIVAQLEAETSDAVSDEERAALNARVDELVKQKGELVSRATIVLGAIEAKGGDVAGDRAYIEVIQSLQPSQTAAAPAEPGPAPTEADQKKVELDAKVAEALGAVRERPPVHERPEPWTVPVRELELELQPLRRDELTKRIDAWLGILQRQVSARIRTDIALAAAEDPAVQQRLADRAAQQQQVVTDVTKRLQAALLILQKRGGDVNEYEQYVASATGQKLNLTDFNVLLAQVTAWLKSPDGGIKIALSIAKFLGILLLTWILSRVLGKAAKTAVKRIPKASSLLQDFVVGSVKRVTLIIGLVIGIYYLGVNITPLVAAIGAAGLVIGLALQGTLSNFASGLLILIYRPYDVGDVIDGGGVTGKVEAMNLVSTRVLTFDNQVMIVPNNSIWNGVITNVTGRKTRRVDLTFGIGYGSDIGKATSILEEAMKGHDKVLADPAPVVRVHSLGDNSVNLIARPWVRTAEYWDVYWDLMREVKERFDAEGINIPFPQRDLHIPGTIEVRLANGSRDKKAAAAVESKRGAAVAVHEPGPTSDDEDDAS